MIVIRVLATTSDLALNRGFREDTTILRGGTPQFGETLPTVSQEPDWGLVGMHESHPPGFRPLGCATGILPHHESPELISIPEDGFLEVFYGAERDPTADCECRHMNTSGYHEPLDVPIPVGLLNLESTCDGRGSSFYVVDFS